MSEKVNEIEIIFDEPLLLTWPARTYWYPFLAELHKSFSKFFRRTYSDKDILLPSHLQWESVGYYQCLTEFYITIVRFNERVSLKRTEQPSHRIRLLWHDYNHVKGYLCSPSPSPILHRESPVQQAGEGPVQDQD